ISLPLRSSKGWLQAGLQGRGYKGGLQGTLSLISWFSGAGLGASAEEARGLQGTLSFFACLFWRQVRLVEVDGCDRRNSLFDLDRDGGQLVRGCLLEGGVPFFVGGV
ncbi:MAG TPA: hypothetical protein P5568_09735, partial [Acidobacteriota bacterium]|nr:hypothetical protein [Acidobacteriota bacterium]